MLTAIDKGSYVGSGTPSNTASSASTPIDSSNIGFQVCASFPIFAFGFSDFDVYYCCSIQLLKKHGWKEGTGLGVSEQDILLALYSSLCLSTQGRLEPIQTSVKKTSEGWEQKNQRRQSSNQKSVMRIIQNCLRKNRSASQKR
ncbi:hypothetical protein ACS0TY_011410 [Phlomoides rotata]